VDWFDIFGVESLPPHLKAPAESPEEFLKLLKEVYERSCDEYSRRALENLRKDVGEKIALFMPSVKSIKGTERYVEVTKAVADAVLVGVFVMEVVPEYVPNIINVFVKEVIDIAWWDYSVRNLLKDVLSAYRRLVREKRYEDIYKLFLFVSGLPMTQIIINGTINLGMCTYACIDFAEKCKTVEDYSNLFTTLSAKRYYFLVEYMLEMMVKSLIFVGIPPEQASIMAGEIVEKFFSMLEKAYSQSFGVI